MPTASRTETEPAPSAGTKPLKGRVAIVTGSTSGIGLGIAKTLAANGCAVVLNGLADQSAIEKERQVIAGEHSVNVLFHPADMMQPDQIRQLVQYAVEELGGVDILVNNAGIQHTAPTTDFPDEKWDAVMSINLDAPFHMIKATLPHMLKKGWGRIINIASVHGLVASNEKIAYVTAKHGLIGMTKVVALETADKGITCNAICPGWVRTPLVEAQIAKLAERDRLSPADAAFKLLSEKQPSGRFVEVAEIAQMAVFLASDAAANMTGASLVVDGGWTAR